MESLEERTHAASAYLERLKDPKVFSEVQKAVESKDESAFINACRKVKIPMKHVSNLKAILLTPYPYIWP